MFFIQSIFLTIKGISFCFAMHALQQDNSLPELTSQTLFTACSQAHNLFDSANYNDVDPYILASLIYQETRWQKDAVSKVKACGLTQVIGKYIGVSCQTLIDSPDLAIESGAFVLSNYLNHTNGNLDKALQCYSTGYKCSYPKYSRSIIKRAKKIKQKHTLIIATINQGIKYVSTIY